MAALIKSWHPRNWSTERRIFVAQVSDRVVRSGGNVALAILTARTLGAEAYGLLAFLITVVGFTSLCSTLGLANFLLISFAKIPDAEAKTWISSIITLPLFGALLCFAITLLFLMVFRGSATRIITMGALIAGSQLLQGFDTYEPLYLAQGRISRLLGARWVAFMILAVARGVACYHHARIEVFAGLAGLDLGLYGVIYLLYGIRDGYQPSWSAFRLPVIKQAMRGCWPIVVSGATVLVYMRYDQFLITRYWGDHALGEYSVAVSIAELWNFVANALGVAFTGRLTRTLADGPDQTAYQSVFCRLTRLAFWGSCLYSAGVFVFASLVVPTLYGHAFAEAAQPLRILCWTAPLIAVGILNAVWYIQHGAQSVWLLQTLIVAGFSMATNQLIVPSFGVVGAAVTMVCSQILACVLLNGVFSATHGLFAMQMKGIFNFNLNSTKTTYG